MITGNSFMSKRKLNANPKLSIPAENQWFRLGIPLLVAAVTFIVFLPALKNGFVNWDDNTNFLNNPYYRGLGLTQLRWMFTTFWGGPYQPLSWISLGLDYVLWGMRPAGYHLTNILLHSLNAALFFALSLRLLRLGFGDAAEEKNLRWGAVFASLIFAVHPLRVESVAWITERRDVLSGAFYLASAIYYLRAAAPGAVSARARPLALSLGFFTAALLSKAIGIGLGFVLLALDVYPLKRLPLSPGRWAAKEFRPVFVEKLPFLILGLAAGLAGVFGQQQEQGLQSLETCGMAQRVAQSLYGLAFYLWKTLIPAHLIPFYKPPLTFDPFAWPFLLSGSAVVVLGALIFRLRGRWPGLLTAALAYVVFLAPVIGLLKMGAQIAADRYTYLACAGWAVLAGGLLIIFQKTAVRITARAAALLIAAVLACFTWRQTSIWQDSEKLWRHTLAVDPESEFAHNNLGTSLTDQGKLDEAVKHFREALRNNPGFAEAYKNIGGALLALGKPEEAVKYCNEALRIKPDYADAHYNLGCILASQGKLDEALLHYREAVRIKPDYTDAYYNSGRILAARGKLDEALLHYREVIRIVPGYAAAYNNISVALLASGKPEEAVKYLNEALRIKPEYADAHHNLGLILSAQGKLDEAVTHFREALRINPDYVDAHINLSVVLFKQGKVDEAINQCREALRVNPDYAAARNNLAFFLKRRAAAVK